MPVRHDHLAMKTFYRIVNDAEFTLIKTTREIPTAAIAYREYSAGTHVFVFGRETSLQRIMDYLTDDNARHRPSYSGAFHLISFDTIHEYLFEADRSAVDGWGDCHVHAGPILEAKVSGPGFRLEATFPFPRRF